MVGAHVELGQFEVVVDNPVDSLFVTNKEFVPEEKTNVSMSLGKGAAKVKDPEPTHSSHIPLNVYL